MLHFSNEISESDLAYEVSLLITASPIVNLWILKQPLSLLLSCCCCLLCYLFHIQGEAQNIGTPTFLVVEKAYCFLAAAALFVIFELQG